MIVSNGLRRVADLIERFDEGDVTVLDADVRSTEQGDEDAVAVDLRLSVPVESISETTGDDATASERTAGQVAGSQSPPRPAPGAEQTAADVVECPHPGCTATFDSEPGMKIHRTKVHRRGGGDGDADDPPAYRDPEALARVYDACDSFPEMVQALAVDVSAQTVRRKMIEHGIHDPTGGQDAPPADEAVEQGAETDEQGAETDEQGAETNGNGAEPDGREAEPDEGGTDALASEATLAATLPADATPPGDVTLGEVKRVVETADTLYDVQQRFDVDRESAKRVLEELNLLELVHGRVATRREREELKAEIDRRIRQGIADAGTSA
jgi:hypothetical protein